MVDQIRRIDLNCDMGELIDGRHNNDQEFMPYISSCNVSCGFHSGDSYTIQRSIMSAIQHGVKVGAHPSYNDKENFGRKSLDVPLNVLSAEIRYQVSAIKSMTESLGGRLHHTKAHGALYNLMNSNVDLAHHYIQVIKSIDPQLIIYAMDKSCIIDVCREYKMNYKCEVFIDRNYSNEKTLVPRSQHNALIESEKEIYTRIDNIINYKLKDINQISHQISVDTICIHSDTPNALAIAKKTNAYLKSKSIEISAD